MKILTVIGVMAIVTVVGTGLGVGAVLLGRPGDAAVAGLLAGLGATVLVVGPLTLGSVVARFDPRASPDATRIVTRTRIATAAVGLVGVAAFVALVPIAGTPWWYLLPVLAVGVAVQVLAVPVGDRLRGIRERGGRPAEWTPVQGTEVTRVIRSAGIAFLIGAVASAMLFAALAMVLDGAGDDEGGAADVVQIVLLSLSVAAMAAGVTVQFSSQRFATRMIGLADGDLGRLQRIAKKVLRGRGDLEPGDELPAARYAGVFPTYTTIILTGVALLYGGLVVQNLSSLLDGFGGWMQIVAIILLPVLLAVVLPLALVQVRRARRYSQDAQPIEETLSR